MWTSSIIRPIVAQSSFCLSRMASTTAIAPKLHILHYDYVENVVEKRKPYREAHLAFINKQVESGNVILGGAAGNPPSEAFLIFRNLSSKQIEEVAQRDPYVVHGIARKYSVKPYMAVVGDDLLKNDLIKI
ncbi:unnamed protein product [Adineta ricciae]|uniref:YCII-related domain-containing protein n=1 Tax=Adineta ricciae TaxID=249248 RepID=A0A814TFK6_ADIRI|nr:unnamed protein product [Adineta ricciae]CAF1182728.1 unnamed protein product [Adineta ricciae]